MKNARLLRVREAAALAAVSRGLAYQLVRSGEWPSVRVTPRCLRVSAEAFEAWLEGKLREE